MKYILLLLLVTSSAFAGFYNTNTACKVDALPNPLVYGGKTIFNAKWPVYHAAGWYKLQSDVIPYGYNVLETNFTIAPRTVLVFTNGVTLTNYLFNSEYVVKETYTLQPTIVSKPEFTQLAELQYITLWRALYGQTDIGYTNAEYATVAIEIMQMAQTNPSVFEYTHTMERTFEFMRSWWTNETKLNTFHPYPWGQTTNIVIKDVVGN